MMGHQSSVVPVRESLDGKEVMACMNQDKNERQKRTNKRKSKQAMNGVVGMVWIIEGTMIRDEMR